MFFEIIFKNGAKLKQNFHDITSFSDMLFVSYKVSKITIDNKYKFPYYAINSLNLRFKYKEQLIKYLENIELEEA